MRPLLLLAWMLLGSVGITPFLRSQTYLVTSDYFPADLEFKELESIESEQRLGAFDSLAELPEAPLLEEVGFRNYKRRRYTVTSPADSLVIEIVVLKDPKAAYSLFTLFRSGTTHKGPPGDFFSTEDNRLIFVQADALVRILNEGSNDLAMRVAGSVSNRIGRHEPPPQLISQFSNPGFDPLSVRYFLGPKSLAKFGYTLGTNLKFQNEMEVAQARYRLEDQTGILSLVDFPTIQLAEEHFDNVFGLARSGAKSNQRFFLKRAGPLVGILEGTFDPSVANKILDSIEFTYSIQWIFDRNKSGAGNAWGVSGGVLGTVVRSLVFTGLLGGISLVAGVAVAFFRILLRGYAPNNFLDRRERTEVIRLKIDEN